MGGSPPYCKEFIDFINYSTTGYHAVEYAIMHLTEAGYVPLAEENDWTSTLQPGGKYYVTRNGSSIIAFAIGKQWTPGGPFAMVGSHIDALHLKVKPVSKSEKGGYERLSVAPYSGGGASQSFDGSFSTWWDRDLGLGGRVLVKGKDGVIHQKIVSLPRPIGRIPSLAVHFGAPAKGPFNYETNFVPIIGLTDDSSSSSDPKQLKSDSSVYGSIEQRHSARLIKAISRELGVSPTSIVDFDLEMFDFQPATTLGLSQELIAAPRLDDKLCSFSALWGLINASTSNSGGVVQLVGLFDNEEIGSGLRQGAKSNFIQTVVERIVESQVTDKSPFTINLIGQSLAKSFLVSADVAHAFNPNFASQYLAGASPELNKGVVIKVDSNMHYTSNAPGSVLLRSIAEKCGCELQLFHIRNDSRSGGTIGPMLSERLGCPTIDVGVPQLSMHSVRAITGNQDPGLGVKFFEGFLREYESARSDISL